MINWSKYFDRIYCLHYIPYTERKQLMQFQLDRVDILNSGIFEWWYTYGNNLDKKFNQYIKTQKKKEDIYFTSSVSLGHYNIARDAYTKGYNKILILEDDERFLKDLNKIEQILENKPKQMNLIMYDKFIFGYDRLKQFQPINQYYSLFKQCCSAGCYELDRKGMQKKIQLMENDPQTADGYTYNAQLYLKGIRYCCSTINIAIQGTFKNSMNTKLMGNQVRAAQMFYTYLNINFNDYMIRKNGGDFKFGNYIEE